MRASVGAFIATGLAGLTLAGCNRDQGAGYVEIKTVPVTAQGSGGQLALLCDLVVKKDRITTSSAAPINIP